MALKALLKDPAELTTMAETLRSLYRKVEEAGKPAVFVLDVESVDGWGLEDVGGLKTVLAERREDLRKAKENLEKYKDLDPETARQAMTELQKLGNLSSDEKVQLLIEQTKQQIEEKHSKTQKELQTQLQAIEQEFERTLVDNVILGAITKHDGNPKLLAAPVKAQTIVVKSADGKRTVKVVNPKTMTPLISQKQNSTEEMSIEELVETMKRDPDYAGAFKGNGSSGAGSSGSGGGSGNGGNDLLDPNLPPEQRLGALRRR